MQDLAIPKLKAAAEAATSTPDTIVEISLDDLHESPFNPRKTFKGLAELAASIQAEGRIHEPLLVRPRIGPLFGVDPAAAAGYEIVFGHRRYRAAPLAGLATVPCMVRAMTDAQARSAQAAENLQREAIEAFEEAEGYQAMMADDKLSAEAVAAQVGKSVSHVYARLKLLQAVPQVRKACEQGELGAEVALLVARLRTPKLQEKALARIKACHIDMADGGQRSFRHIRAELAEHFTLKLKKSIFDREDDTLLPVAGVCSACPKRSGNAPEYTDLATETVGRYVHQHSSVQRGQPDLCTDPDCWAAKKDAHLKREAGKLQAAGHQVVQGNAARQAVGADGKVKGAFVALADVKAMLKGKKTDAPVPQVVTIQNPRDGKPVKAVRLADLQAAGLASADKRPDDAAARKAKEEAQRAKIMRKVADVSAQRMGLLRHVREVAAGRELGVFELRMAVAAALQCVGWDDRHTLQSLYPPPPRQDALQHLRQQIDGMEVPALTRLLLDCLLVDNVRCEHAHQMRHEPGPLLALAAHYGVDAQAVMQASALPPEPPTPPTPKATSTPSTAGASAKRRGAAPAKKSPPRAAVAYRCPDTGMTWSGRGLKPAWLRAALAQGKTLDSLRAAPAGKVTVKASSAGQGVTDDAGAAGDGAQMARAEEEGVSA